MLATPSEEYIKASKLIESFGSFFEKLAQISNNPNQNSQRLTQLKSVLYQNIYSSQDTLNNVLEELCGKQQEPLDKSRQLTKTNSMASINLLESSLRIEPQTPLVSQTPIKSDYASQDFTQMLLSRSEAKQAPAQDGVNQEIHDHSFHTEYLPITNFLSHLKAGSHQETSKLFSMTSNYLHARSFHDQQNSVFTALCFSFFEKVLREKAKDPQNLLPQTLTFKLNEEIQDIDFKETDLLAFLKALPQNITESEMVKKFYEYIPTNPKLHQSLLSIFKEILSKVFPEKQQNISGKHDQFDWFNEIDNNQELSSLQNLTQIFKCAIRFLILNKEKLIEKTFAYDRSQPSSLNSISSQPSITRKDVTIFFDKSTKTSFILYPLRKAYDEDFESPLHQKIKAKITGGVNSRPPLDVGSQKSIKSIGVDQQGSSLTTLDTITSPITSLNEILDHKEKQERAEKPGLLRNAPRVQQLRKANTLNVFTTSLNDISNQSGYPESAVLKPSEKFIPPSPLSVTHKNSFQHHQFKGYEPIEDFLVPKDKEPVPIRPQSFQRSREGAHADDKLFNYTTDKAKYDTVEFSRQNSVPFSQVFGHVLANKTNRDTPTKNLALERCATQEYSRKIHPNETSFKSRNEYASAGKNYSVDFTRGDLTTRRISEVTSIMRPMGISSSIKNKFDKINQTINKHDHELDHTIGRYMKKENILENKSIKNTNLDSIMKTYQSIMNQPKELNGPRPSIGTALRMDF